MFEGLLHLHNVLRWLVLIAAVVAVGGAWFGFLTGREFGKGGRLRGLLFTIGMDLQLVLGLVLVFRPGVMDTLTEGMVGEGFPRYIEHIFWMIIAVALVHVGTVMSKRGDDDKKKHRSQAIFFTIALLAMAAAIPWGRPFFPGM